MSHYLAELIGTALLILLGNGVVAGVVLDKTKSQNSGWIVITAGWGLAVLTAVYAVGRISGAHLNPAVTLGLAFGGEFAWNQVPLYVAAQLLGAMIGSIAVYLHYLPHYQATTDEEAILATFATSPAIKNLWSNLLSEILGTAVLLFPDFDKGRLVNIYFKGIMEFLGHYTKHAA